MNFLQEIYVHLLSHGDAVVVRERGLEVTGRELRGMIASGRAFLRRAGVARGDRVVLVGANSAQWIAFDLAVMAEGALSVPLYPRQAPDELAAMARDCTPVLLLCDDPVLLGALEARLDGAGIATGPLADAFAEETVDEEPAALEPTDAIRIVYTSGTSGDAKGAVLDVGNVDFMLPRTSSRLDHLMAGREGTERIFHYLPFCFAGSWILLLTGLVRRATFVLCSDLKRVAEEMREASPHYVLNVPLLLERVRAGIEERIRARGPLIRWLFARPRWGRLFLYPAIRRRLGPDLRALICGSAPLAEDTQRFFMMLGLPVLQVYGLTETTAIATMDEPGHAVPGRVGRAVAGCEMRLDGAGEIEVSGRNVFRGYWGRPPHEGWLKTGDLGEVDAGGTWRILGRAKNLLVLAGGHNVAPEPLELELRLAVPGAAQVVLVGDGRPALAAIVAGPVRREDAAAAVGALNERLPHFKRIRAFHLHPTALTPDEGLLTANGKLRRAAIHARFTAEIEELYR